MDGLTTRHTLHRLILGGVDLWTWRAYDIVGIAAALKADAVGDTLCGLCGRRIEVVVLEGEPQTTTGVAWLPDESCSNAMAEFCPIAPPFCSLAHLNERIRRGEAGSGEALEIQALAERGREFWKQLVP